MACLIEVEGLTRRYGTRVAVDSVSVTVDSGEIVGLLGPNGAGKTTTLRAVGGLILPTAGRVAIGGLELTRRTAGAVRSQIGFLTEAAGLWDRLSLRANLLVHARLFGVPSASTAVDRTLHSLDLWDRRDERAAVLSKGLRQRLALARALVHGPRVLLLDEPTSGLDPKSARTVRQIILDLKRDGCAIMISTHNLDEAERISDRVAVLNQRLLALDRPEVLRRRLFGHRVRIVLTGPAAAFAAGVVEAGARDPHVDGPELSVAVDDPERVVPVIVSWLVSHGATVRQIADERPDLERIYLRLVDRTPSSTAP